MNQEKHQPNPMKVICFISSVVVLVIIVTLWLDSRPTDPKCTASKGDTVVWDITGMEFVVTRTFNLPKFTNDNHVWAINDNMQEVALRCGEYTIVSKNRFDQ